MKFHYLHDTPGEWKYYASMAGLIIFSGIFLLVVVTLLAKMWFKKKDSTEPLIPATNSFTQNIPAGIALLMV